MYTAWNLNSAPSFKDIGTLLMKANKFNQGTYMTGAKKSGLLTFYQLCMDCYFFTDCKESYLRKVVQFDE